MTVSKIWALGGIAPSMFKRGQGVGGEKST